MTNYALILDNNAYNFVELMRNEPKHCLIRDLTTKVEKKIKLDNLILSFDQNPKALAIQIDALSAEIDLPLLWELCAEQEVWAWDDLVELYYGNNDLTKKLALFKSITGIDKSLLSESTNQPNMASASENQTLTDSTTCSGKMLNWPSGTLVYFNYQGQEQFKRNNENEIRERKLLFKQQQENETRAIKLYQQLINLEKPDWSIDPLTLINKPDKNSLEYKVAFKVAKELKLTLTELLFRLGYISSVEELLITAFVKQYFPQGTELAPLVINDHSTDITLNDKLNVFSIDDSMTTEIDDAFSLQKKDDGSFIIGIHISAPALNHELLNIASERLSTVYYPGHKITMLPENVISHYSLDQGKELPVVSIYFDLDADMNILENETKLERVVIKENLRTESLEQLFNNENLSVDHGYPYENELKTLHRFALKLEEKRGRPSVNQLTVDYNFSFENGKIQIKPRLRGNPIDKLVSELMILANCSWGRMLTNAFIPAIYRVKQPMQPVTMTLTPNSHTGLNVDYYTWASSPLRRAVDLINQSQIISLITKQKPLSATDFAVANIVEYFDKTYAEYLKFQDSLERYWSLRYLEQENIHQVQATFTYRNNVQLDGVPIMLDVGNITKAQPPGTVITLAIDNFNFVNQTFDFKLVS